MCIIFRGQGLVWIIQKLLKLGVVLDPSMLPDFLAPLEPSPQAILEQLARKETDIQQFIKMSGRHRSQHSPTPSSGTMPHLDLRTCRPLSNSVAQPDTMTEYGVREANVRV